MPVIQAFGKLRQEDSCVKPAWAIYGCPVSKKKGEKNERQREGKRKG